jgi:hypothetical protein
MKLSERSIKIKELISGQVDMGTFGLIELELIEFDKELIELKKLRVTDVSGSVCDLHDNMNDCDMYRFRKQEACKFCKYKQTVH